MQAPLHTPVTKDKFSILTKNRRIPVPILPGMIMQPTTVVYLLCIYSRFSYV